MERRRVDWSEVVRLLDGRAQLATVRPDGTPHVAIVSPGREGDTVWVATLASSATARNVAANPGAALVWSPGHEAYVWGEADLVTDAETRHRLWDLDWGYDPAGFFGSPDSPELLLLRLRPGRAMVMTAEDGAPVQLRWSAP